MIILPVIAKDVLNVDAVGLGILSASSGLGATISTLGVAALGNFKNKGMLLAVTAISSGVSLIVFAFSQWFFLSIIVVAWIGGSLMAYDVTMGTLLQLMARQDMRGRVLGLYGLTFGFTPLGGFILGWVASILSAPIAIAAGGFIITAYLSKIARTVAGTNVDQDSSEFIKWQEDWILSLWKLVYKVCKLSRKIDPGEVSNICINQCKAMCCRGPIVLTLSNDEFEEYEF